MNTSNQRRGFGQVLGADLDHDSPASTEWGLSPGWLGLVLLIFAIIVGTLMTMNWSGRATEELSAPPRPFVALPPLEQPLPSLWIEDLTWTEIAQAQAEGYDTVLIATGGTEQNGPHLPTGKHNSIVRFTAQKIAEGRGKTLIAPVMAYVPEQPHVNFPGTISLPTSVFQGVIEAAAQSFLNQGFKSVVLIGDSGGNQASLRAAAAKVNQKGDSGRRVVFLDHYYTGHGQAEWLEEQGFGPALQGTHAGLADTAEWLAAQTSGLRNVAWIERTDLGHNGRADLATAELGRLLLQRKITAALQQLSRELPE